MLSAMNPTSTTHPDTNQPAYRSYLLRLWRTPQAWHASLDDPHTGKRLGFASLEQLFAYLMEVTEHDEQVDSL
jgi:hypothetical protein